MESNLLLEQYSWYKKQQLAKAPFECLLNADIEPNPHQVNAFCAAIQALKTGGIILADEVGLGKTIEAGLVLNYVLDNEAKKVLISLPATLRKQWEVELLEKFGRQAVILDRYTVEHDLANVQTHLGNADEVSIVLMKDAFQEALVCTNDPECLNNVPAGNNSNGAACHSCCMISETACENGNRMLDRGLIVPIDGRENQSYFKTLVEELCQLVFKRIFVEL